MLPALDEVGAHSRKEKRRLLTMIRNGRRPFMLALGHELGEQFLHGILGIVCLTASRPRKGTQRMPVASIKC